MYLKFLIVIILLLTQMPNNVSAQDSTTFFPHHLGDVWEYYYTDATGSDILQANVVFDSTDTLSNSFITISERLIISGDPSNIFFDNYFINMANHVYAIFPTDSLLWFKLNAEKSDIWKVGDPLPWAIVDSIWQDELFGTTTTFKKIDFYSFIDTASTDTTFGIQLEVDILAEGFGIIYRGSGELPYVISLKGAVIDGVTYGDTTVVGISEFERVPLKIPEQIQLNQNYPNPFNLQTTISFALKYPNKITVMIYDITGKEVKKLIDNQLFYAGLHKIRWNGKTEEGGDAASGFYIYQISTKTQSISQKMLLIK